MEISLRYLALELKAELSVLIITLYQPVTLFPIRSDIYWWAYRRLGCPEQSTLNSWHAILDIADLTQCFPPLTFIHGSDLVSEQEWKQMESLHTLFCFWISCYYCYENSRVYCAEHGGCCDWLTKIGLTQVKCWPNIDTVFSKNQMCISSNCCHKPSAC